MEKGRGAGMTISIANANESSERFRRPFSASVNLKNSTPRSKVPVSRVKSMISPKCVRYGGDPGSGGSCPSSPNVKKAFRLVILGSANTGKTCILRRFLEGDFIDSYRPTIEDFYRKLYKIRGDFYQIDILDTSGTDPFPATRRLSLLTGDLFLLVCSLDSEGSGDQVFRLRDQIVDLKKELFNLNDPKTLRIPIVVAVNKTDLPSEKHRLAADSVKKRAAEAPVCAYIETSAKENLHVVDVFDQLFHLAKLPKELSPTISRRLVVQHSNPLEEQKCQADSNATQNAIVRLKSRRGPPVSEICLVDTDARRPSLRTDLLLLRTKSSNASLKCFKEEKQKKKCLIM